MKILLVNPPRSPHNAILEHASAESAPFIHKKLIGPPLGLLTVAGAMRDHDVALLETKGEYDLDPGAPPLPRLVRGYLERHRPDVAGVTFIASEFNAGMEILEEVKRFDPGILTVAGGLHATLCPGDFARDAVDVVCPGQSAHAFRKVVEAREEGRGLDHVGGILVRKEGRLVGTPAPASPVDAAGADFIMPDRSLLRRWVRTYTVGKGRGPATYLFTSLGCPHRCTFCSIWPQFGGTFSQRSVESIIEELKTLDEYPVVRFADANTVIDTGFIRRLFDRIEEEGIEKDFVMDMRVDTAAANPRLVEKMARGGLKVVICGFESFRKEELDGYGKGTEPRLIIEAVRRFQECGVMIRGNYVIPPGYGEDDFKALADFADSHRVAYAGYTLLTPLPGTAYYREAEARIIDHDLDKYNFFNCVMRSKLPLERLYENTADLWKIKEGTDVI